MARKKIAPSSPAASDRGAGDQANLRRRRYAAHTDETLKLAAEAVAAHGVGQRLRLVKSGAAKRRATN